MNENDIMKLVEQVMLELNKKNKDDNTCQDNSIVNECINAVIEDGEIPDITEVDLKSQILVPNPEHKEEFLKLKNSTPARVGVWRAGPRYKTETMLRFRADHAVAMDAVFNDVSEEFLNEMNLFSIKTKCNNKDEYLTRPDLGRKFDEEELQNIKNNCIKNPQVQIYVSDGLSSTSIEANVRDVLPAIIQGLEGYGIKVGTPFFVKYGRVPAMDVISETTGADVTCVLIGERPGLATGESMSAYIAYKATINMPEARRTVVSNIHKGGTPPVEAGAHIADIIKLMLEKKASGLDLKL
ncbi:ethanolamine ammonia-lyase subunit EutC [Clostridium tetanomorphum]|uniref:ethanolamine ammonia-lyase subunit EutC n=1 Tax=Clostridium tetanomorphum TaxID=1553 RepID=UPI0030B85CF7